MTTELLTLAQIPARSGGERSSTEDLRLAQACAEGDPAALETIYKTHGDRMKSIAANHLGNIADAEDAVQETFLKIHRAASGFNGTSSFSTWAFRILINTCYDMLRKRKRHPEDAPFEAVEGSSREATSPADTAARLTLRKLVNELTPQRRSVFLLFEVEGLTHAEIADILQIREGHSKWLLFTAKQTLRQSWSSSREARP